MLLAGRCLHGVCPGLLASDRPRGRGQLSYAHVPWQDAMVLSTKIVWGSLSLPLLSLSSLFTLSLSLLSLSLDEGTHLRMHWHGLQLPLPRRAEAKSFGWSTTRRGSPVYLVTIRFRSVTCCVLGCCCASEFEGPSDVRPYDLLANPVRRKIIAGLGLCFQTLLKLAIDMLRIEDATRYAWNPRKGHTIAWLKTSTDAWHARACAHQCTHARRFTRLAETRLAQNTLNYLYTA